MVGRRSEGRKPCWELAWLCLIFRIFCYWYCWACLGWQAWRGQNLVGNWLNFAWFLLFNCYCGVLLCVVFLL
jgi:hypothetical protein